MPNNRVYWAITAVGFGGDGATSFTEAHGVQSVSLDTTFELEQAFEWGQLEVYENVEGLPNVEMTVEKVIDGYPLVAHLATPNATNPELGSRFNEKCTAAMSIFSDGQTNASGTPISQLICSGLYVNSLNYNFSNDGFFTESVGLIGNTKTWLTSAFTFDGTLFDGTDTPLFSGGILRREDFDWTSSILPNQIPGIDTSGKNLITTGQYGAHVFSIAISTELNRDPRNELGRLLPYYYSVGFPVTVGCDIEVANLKGDLINVNAEGGNLVNSRIYIALEDGTTFDLGDKNKLSSISYGGGESGGDDSVITFSYETFNKLTILSPEDPASL